MKLSVTILAGSYRATDREIIMHQPFHEQAGDLIVTVSAENLNPNTPLRIVLEKMLREAEASLDRQLKPVIINRKEGT